MAEIIKSGEIKKSISEHERINVSYEMRYVDEETLPEILELQDIVRRGLPTFDYFRTDSEDYWHNHFRGYKNVLGVFSEDKLIGYGAISFPGPGEDNFGKDVGLDDNEVSKTAHLETAAINPDYRGNSLQQTIIAIFLKELHERDYVHVCCTTSPKNYPSVKNLMSCGFVVKAIKVKFNGMIRYIMYKNIKHPMAIDPNEEDAVMPVDIERQMRLIKNGYVGFKINKLSEGFEVVFGK